MGIEIIAIGKQHDPLLKDAILRYEKRLLKPFTLTWTLLAHSPREAAIAAEDESQRILSRIPNQAIVILLDERGDTLDSPALARKIDTFTQRAVPIIFVIGGSYGVSEAIFQRANLVLSLSKLVFPHQLVRLLLIEQLYRAQSILHGQPYHHE